MRKMQVQSWKAKNQEGKDIEESIVEILSVMISSQKPEDMPRGLEKARMFNRLISAFDKSKESKELILEEADYMYLKKILENDIPAMWGSNKNIMTAIETFVELKQE